MSLDQRNGYEYMTCAQTSLSLVNLTPATTESHAVSLACRWWTGAGGPDYFDSRSILMSMFIVIGCVCWPTAMFIDIPVLSLTVAETGRI